MLRQGCGAAVNVASIAGVVGYLNAADYTASNHGVVGLTRNAAIDLAAQGIRVNAVCPGPILTPTLQQASAARGPERMSSTSGTSRWGGWAQRPRWPVRSGSPLTRRPASRVRR
jgi:NAD(P)-dependent dehydrogenase (short-subunit alcohol dehydrogenase family)